MRPRRLGSGELDVSFVVGEIPDGFEARRLVADPFVVVEAGAGSGRLAATGLLGTGCGGNSRRPVRGSAQ